MAALPDFTIQYDSACLPARPPWRSLARHLEKHLPKDAVYVMGDFEVRRRDG